MEADLMEVKLEREFQALCGEDCEPEAIQVCSRLERVIKDTEVLVIAGVVSGLEEGEEGPDPVVSIVGADERRNWLEELECDEHYGEDIRKGETRKEVRLPRMSNKLKVADLLIEDDNLKLISEDDELLWGRVFV
ncbi:unnamed protein product [Nippostrongylus brasiliensis]|uniref:Reverse transcriptase n=1 Tax=Nippostrongylus brasiliensis TaxID=27835 RepID=A0A0N4XE12_NIPBR|nr:unnamed protein product [Nippostrongylus brasiliensis]